MSISKTSAVSAIVVVCAAVAASMTASTVQAEPKEECELAAEWVAANLDRLPTTLSEVAAYPMAYRRAIHGALPRETQTNLWREHLTTFLSADTELNGEQQIILVGVLENFEPYFDPATRVAADSALRLQVDAAFTRGQAAAIFATLGPSQISDLSTSGASSAANLTSCECNTSSNYCWTTYCTSKNCETPPGGGGCGTFGQYECNGRCGGAGPDPK